MNEFFGDCDLRKVHEFLLYLVTAVVLIALYFQALLQIGKKYSGLGKQLIGNLSAIIPIGLMFLELWLIDERIILSKNCAAASVDTMSVLVWSAALVVAVLFNFLFFGRRLKERGFYTR